MVSTMNTQNTQACLNCGHRNPADATSCTKCKQTLNRKSKSADTPITKFDSTSAIPDLVDIGILDETDYGNFEVASADVQTLYIEDIDEEDKPISDGDVRLKGGVILTERETGTKFEISQDELQEAVIGRVNRQTGIRPKIDLTSLEAHKYGVSRRHATIRYRDNWLLLIDHASTNGTFINGHRLVPEQPRVIRDNDTIRVGGIVLHVKYQQKG